MLRISQILDSDWKRLNQLAVLPLTKRRLTHSFHPRFAPVVMIRIAQILHQTGKIRLAKLTALVNFVIFGIEVPPRLAIGPGLVLMHTQGTVLGAASIGENVTIYHQVTLGAAVMDLSYTLTLRPIVGDGVVIGVGSKVLGGLTLGQDCVVGANAVVLKNVPPKHLAIGIPARSISQKNKPLESTSPELE